MREELQGTQFSCFTGTKEQILTQNALVGWGDDDEPFASAALLQGIGFVCVVCVCVCVSVCVCVLYICVYTSYARSASCRVLMFPAVELAAQF
jgi:hypothetical protein